MRWPSSASAASLTVCTPSAVAAGKRKAGLVEATPRAAGKEVDLRERQPQGLLSGPSWAHSKGRRRVCYGSHGKVPRSRAT